MNKPKENTKSQFQHPIGHAVPVRRSLRRQSATNANNDGCSSLQRLNTAQLDLSNGDDASMRNIFKLNEIPDLAGEEIVLNRRGNPVRKPKPNRLYHNDEMISGTRYASKRSSKSNLRTQVKNETSVTKLPRPFNLISQCDEKRSSEESLASSKLPKRTSSSSASTTLDPVTMLSREAPYNQQMELKLTAISSFGELSVPAEKANVCGNIGTFKLGNPSHREAVNTSTLSMPDLSSFKLEVETVDKTTSQQHQSEESNAFVIISKNSVNSASFGSATKRSLDTSWVTPRYDMSDSGSNTNLPLWCEFSAPFSSEQLPQLSQFEQQCKKAAAVQEKKETAKREAEKIGRKLRNLLKLPKAHKWVAYEWFYSDIDRAIFLGENDFQACLRENFPYLKINMLRKMEWNKIRRMMGKPRRCSQSFFDGEREDLGRRRQMVRTIQQRRKLHEECSFRDLPEEVPLPIPIGSKVTAIVRKPLDAIFQGSVEAVDTSNNTYRIHFDRHEIGIQSIVDYEVCSVVPPDTIPVSNYVMRIQRYGSFPNKQKFCLQNPLLLENEPEGIPISLFPVEAMLGGFPIRLLELIVRLSKLLKSKRDELINMKDLNVQAEKYRAYGRPYPKEFRKCYAIFISKLDSLNKTITKVLDLLELYLKDILGNSSGSSSPSVNVIYPIDLLTKANLEASEIVSTYNRKNYSGESLSVPSVCNSKISSLLEQMISLLLQAKKLHVEAGPHRPHELKSLNDSLVKIKSSLSGKNIRLFEDKIEIPMKRIIAGMCLSQSEK